MTREWYENAGATFVTLVDESHTISQLYGLVNVPSAVWIDETGHVRRIDEGTYARVHKNGDFEFGRDDYAPMVADWVARGDDSSFVRSPDAMAARLEQPSDDAARADAHFALGVYFHQQGDDAKANHYWEAAQALNPDSWNYHRQDWSFTPEQAPANWMEKFQSLGEKPYYAPIEDLDPPE